MTNEKMKKRVMELLLVLAGNVLMSIGVGAFVIPEELIICVTLVIISYNNKGGKDNDKK